MIQFISHQFLFLFLSDFFVFCCFDWIDVLGFLDFLGFFGLKNYSSFYFVFLKNRKLCLHPNWECLKLVQIFTQYIDEVINNGLVVVAVDLFVDKLSFEQNGFDAAFLQILNGKPGMRIRIARLIQRRIYAVEQYN